MIYSSEVLKLYRHPERDTPSGPVGHSRSAPPNARVYRKPLSWICRFSAMSAIVSSRSLTNKFPRDDCSCAAYITLFVRLISHNMPKPGFLETEQKLLAEIHADFREASNRRVDCAVNG